jgi:hypothetical protein
MTIALGFDEEQAQESWDDGKLLSETLTEACS